MGPRLIRKRHMSKPPSLGSRNKKLHVHHSSHESRMNERKICGPVTATSNQPIEKVRKCRSSRELRTANSLLVVTTSACAIAASLTLLHLPALASHSQQVNCSAGAETCQQCPCHHRPWKERTKTHSLVNVTISIATETLSYSFDAIASQNVSPLERTSKKVPTFIRPLSVKLHIHASAPPIPPLSGSASSQLVVVRIFNSTASSTLSSPSLVFPLIVK